MGTRSILSQHWKHYQTVYLQITYLCICYASIKSIRYATKIELGFAKAILKETIAAWTPGKQVEVMNQVWGLHKD